MNFNLFNGRMQTLPVFIYSQYTHPGVPMPGVAYDRAWGAALVLIVIVMVLNLVARLISALLIAPEDQGAMTDDRQTTVAGRAEAKTTWPSSIDVSEPEHLLRRRSSPSRTSRMTIAAAHGDRADRPVGLRQVDLPALAQPDARGDPRRPRRGQDHPRRRGPLRRRASTRSRYAAQIGMVFQRPNPFPTMSIYDNVARRAAAQRRAAREVRAPTRSSSGRCAAPTSGTRSRTDSTSPARACPAVSSSGSASPARSPSSRRCC